MKTFAQQRNEEKDPFRKLFFEVLNRFHAHDYEAALATMSSDLRQIVQKCKAEMEKQTLNPQ